MSAPSSTPSPLASSGGLQSGAANSRDGDSPSSLAVSSSIRRSSVLLGSPAIAPSRPIPSSSSAQPSPSSSPAQAMTPAVILLRSPPAMYPTHTRFSITESPSLFKAKNSAAKDGGGGRSSGSVRSFKTPSLRIRSSPYSDGHDVIVLSSVYTGEVDEDLDNVDYSSQSESESSDSGEEQERTSRAVTEKSDHKHSQHRHHRHQHHGKKLRRKMSDIQGVMPSPLLNPTEPMPPKKERRKSTTGGSGTNTPPRTPLGLLPSALLNLSLARSTKPSKNDLVEVGEESPAEVEPQVKDVSGEKPEDQDLELIEKKDDAVKPTEQLSGGKKFKWMDKVLERLKSLRSRKTPLLTTHQSKVSSDMAGTAATASAVETASLMRQGSIGSMVKADDRAHRKDYKFIKVIGCGAQGVVSLRLHLPTNSIVALKSISVLSVVSDNVRESFRREVDILRLATPHPNIIRLLDSWEGKFKVYQVFHVCTGGDLASAVLSKIHEEECAFLLAPLFDAVRFLHELDVLHRDIRPANVFLRRPLTGSESLQELSQIPVLADFGIATFEKFSGRLGTEFDSPPAHIAPEVLLGGRFSKKSDVYGLGVVAHHLLIHHPVPAEVIVAGAGPPPETADSTRFTCYSHVTEKCAKLLAGLVAGSPARRLTATQALNCEWLESHGVTFSGPVVKDGEVVIRPKKDL